MASVIDSVVREATLDRLRRARPLILAVSAPAGFGKTTLVEQYLATAFAGARCDCSGVRDGRDLARRVLPHRAALLEDGARPVAERLEEALIAWQSDPRPAVFFDHADDLVGGAAEFFGQLMSARVRTQQIILASRRPLRLRLTRFAALHEIVTLRAEDLAYDLADVRKTFEDEFNEARLLERILDVTRGWPVAVALLKRYAAEGRLLSFVDRLAEATSDALREYISDDILTDFDAAQLQALFVCAAIPSARASAVEYLFPGSLSSDDLADLANESPFFYRDDDGVFTVHPIIAAHLLEHQEQNRSAILERLASWREANGHFERAAELWLANGDQNAAARALSKHDVLADSAPSAVYRHVLAHLDHSLVQRHTSLWGVSTLSRIYCVNPEELLDEAEALRRTVSADASMLDQYFIFVFRVVLMAYLGGGANALAEISSLMGRIGPDTTPPHIMAQMLYLRGFLRARTGKLFEAEDDLRRALPFVAEMDVTEAATLLSLAVDVARPRGDRTEWQFLERSLVRARSAALPNIVALVIAEALFGAWFAGDNAAMLDDAVELDPYVQGGVRNFAYLVHAARGRAVEPTVDDLPEFVAYGRLVAISQTRDENERVRFARSAYANAKRVGMPFLRTICAVAVALCDASVASEFFAAAVEAAKSSGSPELTQAVEAVIERKNDCGMLTAFVNQLARGRLEAQAPVRVEVAAGVVYVDGEPVMLGGRELELLVAISLRRAPSSRAQLAATLWPDLDDAAARNALGVCLHRLRAHLRRKDAIERDGDGYRLHANAEVDLWSFDRVETIIKTKETLSERDRAELERLWQGVSSYRAYRTERWEWFRHTGRRLLQARIELGLRLAEDALSRGESSHALVYARDAVECDAGDEPARAIAIRAHLLAGDRAAALREYRQYREFLREELGIEPSAQLTSLVVSA